MNFDDSLQADDLTVSFNDHPVLDRVSLTIKRTGISVIIGRSGCGKSTFLRSINRLNEEIGGKTTGSMKVRLQSGCREIYDRTIDLNDLRQEVGMVFQTPNLLPSSISRNILLPLKLNGTKTAGERENRMEERLRLVNLWDGVKNRLADPAHSLSGGQQQRLCLARALAMDPEILLLDEPTGSLDYKSTRSIEELLHKLEDTCSMVVVSHSPTQAVRLAEELFIFKDGCFLSRLSREKIQAGEMEEYLEDIF